MKILSLLFLALIMVKGCGDENKQDIKTAKIEYVANTRGFYQKIVIENQMVTISTDRNEKDKPVTAKISKSDWEVLVSEFQEINLEEIPNLVSPTEKRFYDGAAIANLKITYKEKTYTSKSFDHGYPPVEIEKLVTKINSFAKQNNEN